MDYELYHHGILGMKWGIRRYQNPDGTLTEAGRRRLEKKDVKWAKKNYNKIEKKAYKASKQELYEHKLQLDQKYGGKYSKSYFNDFNKKYAEIMTKNAADIKAPSGRSVKFVAKRAEYGVMMALADANYDMAQFKNGVWSSGRIAYKKKTVNIAHSEELYHHGILGMKWGVRNGPPYPLKSDIFDSLSRKNGPITIKNIKDINHNPSFSDESKDRIYNCVNCCAAYDLLSRGYDVSARSSIDGVHNFTDIESLYIGGELIGVNENLIVPDDYFSFMKSRGFNYETLKDKNVYEKARQAIAEYDYLEEKMWQNASARIQKHILSQGDGSRGILVYGFCAEPGSYTKESSGFHAINYEVDNGRILYTDSQSSQTKRYRNTDGYFIRRCNPREIYIMRTDNLKPSNKILSSVYSKR